jgi:hypothetical protein
MKIKLPLLSLQPGELPSDRETNDISNLAIIEQFGLLKSRVLEITPEQCFFDKMNVFILLASTITKYITDAHNPKTKIRKKRSRYND